MKQTVALTLAPVPEPPLPLGEAGLALWTRIQGEYRIQDAGGVELLAVACEATDQAAVLKARIETDGVMIPGAAGQLREHPALRSLLGFQSLVGRMVDRLHLDVAPVKPIGRPTKPRGVSWKDSGFAD